MIIIIPVSVLYLYHSVYAHLWFLHMQLQVESLVI